MAIYSEIRAKVIELSSDSLETIAERVIELEETIESLESDKAALMDEIASLEQSL